MTPTSPPSYHFLDEPLNIVTQTIRQSPIATVSNNTPSSPTTSSLTSSPTIYPPSSSTSSPSLNNINTMLPPQPQPNPNLGSVHAMVTCFRVGTNRHTQRLSLHVSSISPLPKSYTDAFNDPNWQNDIRYKARLVANGSTQSEVLMLMRSLVWLSNQDVLISAQVGMRSPNVQVSQVLSCYSTLPKHERLTLEDSYPRKYATEILEWAHMVNCNPSRTPANTESKLADDDEPISDPTLYRSLAETCWLRNLLRELHTPLSSTMLVYCDNVDAGEVRVLHVLSRYQYADIFTKGFPLNLFEELIRCISHLEDIWKKYT
ncbi:ribonuclease H-like domain-containing protein [Tanacetum coccineum]